MKKARKAKLYFYAFLTAFVMVSIFILSSQDADVSTELSEGFLDTVIGSFLSKYLPILTEEGICHDIRKYAHVFEFFCLGITSSLFYNELISQQLKSALLSCALSLAYAFADEWHQTFVPGRSGQLSDVFIDFAGIVIGVLLTALLCSVTKKKKRRV